MAVSKGPWKLVIDETTCFHGGNRVCIYHELDIDGVEDPVEQTIAEVWPTPGCDTDIDDGKRIVELFNLFDGVDATAYAEEAGAALVVVGRLRKLWDREVLAEWPAKYRNAIAECLEVLE